MVGDAGLTVAQKADIGIAWDGDADRCFFIDDTGEFVPGDFVTALLAEGETSRIKFSDPSKPAIVDSMMTDARLVNGVVVGAAKAHAFDRQFIADQIAA